MKVMTYNILDGGRSDRIESDTRLNDIAELIISLDPDILIVNEAMGFADNSRLRLFEFERMVNRRGFLGEAATGQHVAVLVRKASRVLSFEVDNRHFHHARVKLTIGTKDGPALDVIATHLCPHGGENRVSEAQRLANDARTDRFVLLAGDLNSLDHYSDHVHRVERLEPRYRARHLLPGEDLRVDTRTTKILETAGFIDIVRSLNADRYDYTAPTKIDGAGDEFSHMRVDYILATAPLAHLAVSAHAVRDVTTETLSDHYPVVATFDLDLDM